MFLIDLPSKKKKEQCNQLSPWQLLLWSSACSRVLATNVDYLVTCVLRPLKYLSDWDVTRKLMETGHYDFLTNNESSIPELKGIVEEAEE